MDCLLVGFFIPQLRIDTMDYLKFLTRAQVLGVVRHALTTVAGIAITNGYLDSETAVQLTGWSVAGVSIVWSILSKPVKGQV